MYTWDYHLVALSIVIATIGSYIALDFAGRMKSSKGLLRKLWFAAGSLTMGLAIYTMHFVGMLALKMPMPVSYEPILTALSLLAAIIGAGIAFVIINRQTLGKFQLIFGSIAMGLAIATMHYTGMAAMRMAATIQYDPTLFSLSIAIAILASAGALWLAFQMTIKRPDIWFLQKMGSAMIMGAAISGMHYTGMAAASYTHLENKVSRMELVPTVGTLRLSDILIIASVFFGIALLFLSIQTAWERQKALEDALESEQRFLATFEQAAVGIAQVGLNGKWLKLNQKYCDILGYNHNELLEMTFQKLTHPDDLEVDVNLYRKLIANEIDHYSLNKKYIHKNGSLVWVNLTVSMVRDAQNIPLYSIAIAEDISERKQAEEALHKSLEREQFATEIVDSIRSEMELDTILRQTVNSIGQFTQADRCSIWLYNSKTQQFDSPQHEYYSSKKVVPTNETIFPNYPVLSSILSHTEVANFPDILQVEGLTDMDYQVIQERGIKSLLQVPIIYQDQLLGGLRIHSVFEKREWDNETINLVKNMAAQASIAIYHAQTLQELQASEAIKSGMLESSLDAIITMDHAGKVCEWNASAERILGYPRQEAIGKELAQLIIPEQYRKAHYNGLSHYLATGEGPVMDKLLELPTLRADGSEFLSELTITRIPIAGSPMFSGTLRDITERKRAQDEIQQLTKNLEKRVAERTKELQEEIQLRQKIEETLTVSEERARLLTETVKDYAILMLNPEGYITSWNTGAERIKGYKAHEIIGQHFSIFYPQEAQDQKHPEYELKVAAEKGWFEEEGWRVRKDKSLFWANVTVTALRNKQGELIGFSKITRDLTERKKLEDALVSRSQQLETVNKELEAFSYSVSHDLRAPLRAVDGFSQAVLQLYGDKLEDRGKDYLNRIRHGSQEMAQLIDDMLTLSRLSRGELNIEEEVNLSQTVLEILNNLAQQEPERKIKLDIEEHIRVRGDKRLLQAVMENLINNAWKYTSKHPEAHIEFGKFQSNSTSIYYVKDDGAGFDMQYADKLFGAFQRLHGTAEFPGTGVGLATAARIIHRHGGEIWAEAEVEKGATFYFTLQPVNIKEKQHARSLRKNYSSG